MSDKESSRSERVTIDESVIEVYKELTEGGNAEDTPFRTMKDVFMLAAALGFQRGRRRALAGGGKTTIRKEVFTDADIAILKGIAIASAEDVTVLSDFGIVLTTVEEFAYTGILEVKSMLLDQPGRPLWNLVELLDGTA